MDRIAQLLNIIGQFKQNTNYGISHIEVKPKVYGELIRELESIRGSRFTFELKLIDFFLDNNLIKECDYESYDDMIVVANRRYF